MTLLGQRRGGRLRVRRLVAERPVRQARAPRRRRGSTGWSPTSCASTARRARCSASTRRPVAARAGSSDRGYSRAFVERLIVPQAAAVWSADPDADVELPGALPGRVLRQPRDARLRGPPAVAHGHAAARGATSRRSTRPFADRIRLRAPVTRDRGASDDHVRRRRRALRPGRPRRPRRPGARACSPTRPPPSARCSARSPTSPTRRSCTPTARCCPRRRRAWASWNYHLLERARGRADRHLPHEPPAGARRRPRVLRHAQPHGPDRPRPASCARSTTRTRSTRRPARAAQRRHEEISGARAHALLRRLLGLGLPRGRRGQRAARRRAPRRSSRL